MSSSIGRTLRIVGIILIVILAIELLILSPKLFGRVTYPSDTSAEREVPNLASLPDQDTAPLSSSTPTILPTPTLVVMPTETATPTATQQKIEPTASLTITETAVTETPEPTVVPVVTETISITIAAPLEQTDSAEIPNAYSINSIIHKKQAGFWGYAGPDNLAILMSYWGVKTTQYDVAAVLFGSAERTVDYNVSPSELVSYVQENSDLNVVMRSGGTLELLRELVAAGFPVLIQNSFPVPGDRGWLGHYTIINGYNQTRDTFLTTDTFVGPFQNYTARHIEDSWRAFNNLFIVLYPDARAD
ncbi:MAG TPA: hypothetical protein ENJ56_03825, partial [Anaerolineae bacterium]|nr:hypothetical protein [Anaerolineae bacterium]